MYTKRLIQVLLLFIIVINLISCKKTKENGGNGGNGGGSGGGIIVPPVDPAVANTIGFFLDNWSSKTFVFPAFTDTLLPSSAATVSVNIDASSIITKVPASVFGQNANSWMTQIVTEPSLITDITNLHPDIIRFPGGSISDVYFWDTPPGEKPAGVPDTLLDANGNDVAAGYWYGTNTQNWTISLDNYYTMLQQTGNQGMITVNYAYARYGTAMNPVSAAAHLAADWVRYDNGRTKYWEIGNELNGTWEASYRIDPAKNKDGQPAIITGDLYGMHYKVFADSMHAAAQETGKTIFIGAYLLEQQPASWQTPTDQTWNNGVIQQVKSSADFYIIHSYYTPYQTNATADIILNTATDNTAAMMNYVKTGLTNAGAEIKPIALTEWNITSQGSRQQVSFINGMHAAILVGESIKNKYGETSRWDFANGWGNGNDHGLFNIGDEPGVPKWNPRPAFYYLYFLQKTIGDRMLTSTVTGNPNVLSYASSYSSGQKAVMLVNKSTSQEVAQVLLINTVAGDRFYWYTLTGGTDNGEFSGKVYVNGNGPAVASGGPPGYTSIKAYSAKTNNGIKIVLPARSTIFLLVDK
ncbi:MAG: alpha-L-arabinofuranosidase [Ginsengibacter sp.]